MIVTLAAQMEVPDDYDHAGTEAKLMLHELISEASKDNQVWDLITGLFVAWVEQPVVAAVIDLKLPTTECNRCQAFRLVPMLDINAPHPWRARRCIWGHDIEHGDPLEACRHFMELVR